MSIQSPVSIQLIPRDAGPALVLVPLGGWLRELSTFGASQKIFESKGISNNNAFFRPLGGVETQFSLEVETDYATALAAMNAFLGATEQEGLPVREGSLRILTDTGNEWVFADAVIQGTAPQLPSSADATVTVRYEIRASLPSEIA